jgi:hypothetical protein
MKVYFSESALRHFSLSPSSHRVMIADRNIYHSVLRRPSVSRQDWRCFIGFVSAIQGPQNFTLRELEPTLIN